jgi:ribosomal protein RSM22 (predicted rRNA methylase)
LSLIDLGCGPGTASWAALAAFPGIETVTMVDANTQLLATARALAAKASSRALRRAQAIQGDLATHHTDGADLVLLSYAFTEVPDPKLEAAISAAWACCKGALVVVEPGTPRDHERLMNARNRLIAEDARIAAPCPHAAPCPVVSPDWCHFSVRLPRTREHLQAKGAALGYEDEKFSYLAVVRSGIAVEAPAARVLARPRQTKFATTLKLCGTDGVLVERQILKRDRDSHRRVRRLDWGDAGDP